MHAVVLERQARVADDVADRAGDERCAGRRAIGDARGEIEGRTRRTLFVDAALAGVEADADLDGKAAARFGERRGAANGSRRTVERGDELAFGARELTAAKPLALAGGVLEELRGRDAIDARVQDRGEDAIERRPRPRRQARL